MKVNSYNPKQQFSSRFEPVAYDVRKLIYLNHVAINVQYAFIEYKPSQYQ